MHFDIPVGMTVQFFKPGYNNGDPEAGIVTECTDEGIATLVLMPKFGGEVVCRSSVHHISSEWHKTHPEMSTQCGCWDFVPTGLITDGEATELEPVAAKKTLPEPANKGRK